MLLCRGDFNRLGRMNSPLHQYSKMRNQKSRFLTPLILQNQRNLVFVHGNFAKIPNRQKYA